MRKEESRAWTIVAVFFVSWFLIWGAGPNTGSAFYPPLLKYFGWSRAKLSTGFSVGAFSAGLVGPLVGWLLDRIDARKVMVTGVALTSLGYIGIAESHSFTPFLLSNLTIGVGLCACTGIPCSLVIANWFKDRRGLAMGISLAGASVGGAIMIVVMNYIITTAGWRFAYFVTAAPMVAIVIPLIVAFVRTRPAGETTVFEGAQHPTIVLPGLEVRQAFTTRSLYLVTLIQFLGASIWAGIGQHFIAYLIGIGYSSAFSAHMLSIVFLVTTAGSLLSGPLADKFTARYALGATWIVGAIAMLALLGAKHLDALAVHVVLSGFVIGATGVLTPLLILDSIGIKHYGYLFGLSAVFGTLGFAAGPIITGLIFDVTHSYSLALWIFVIASAVCAMAVYSCVPYEREQERISAATTAAA
jgi:MFS family permease